MSVPRALAAAFTSEQLTAGVVNAARRDRPVEAANCLLALSIIDPEAAVHARQVFLAWAAHDRAKHGLPDGVMPRHDLAER